MYKFLIEEWTKIFNLLNQLSVSIMFITSPIKNQNQISNPFKNSETSSLWHSGKSARPSPEISTAPIIMRSCLNHRRQCYLRQVSFYSDSHERVRHRRSPTAQSITAMNRRRIMISTTSPRRTLMYWTTKWTWMSRRRTHALGLIY